MLYTNGDTIAHISRYTTNVGSSLASSDEVPEPYVSWVNEVLTKADLVLGARAEAESVDYTEPATVTYKDGVFYFKIPKGKNGTGGGGGSDYDDTRIWQRIAEITNSINGLSEDKVGYTEVEDGNLNFYADESKEKLIASVEMPNVDGASLVKDAMTSTTDPAWTEEEQAAAQMRLGIAEKDFELVFSTILETDTARVSIDFADCSEVAVFAVNNNGIFTGSCNIDVNFTDIDDVTRLNTTAYSGTASQQRALVYSDSTIINSKLLFYSSRYNNAVATEYKFPVLGDYSVQLKKKKLKKVVFGASGSSATQMLRAGTTIEVYTR